ncbi:transcriptional regulator [Burkholderia multivorans]|uniref:GntR family transcriptional regulator n=1 Tax=Burkholderia multivorans TaxID=87883 RepID=UPI000D0067ED|nr:GntR family transcriptional regulator [Burkholderia multivorans]MBU9366034.1 GntR family transcriptional regulator [Burkholderia multivorans]PRG77657.1 transcriptional regulator [Burkholderia multivorans]
MTRRAGKAAQLLAKQIIDMIQEARLEVGHHLREQQLADLLGVSRTPVRAAMALLESLGVIEARRNQGFFLARPADGLHRIELEQPASADEDLYSRLVTDRLAGTLPDSLTQTDIAQRYGVDRVTMTRALSRLSEDGLIVRNKGHGWSFPPSLDSAMTLRSSYDFRLTIEPAGLLLPTFAADRSALERCRREHIFLVSQLGQDSVTPKQVFETDANFHEMLAEFSGNVFMHQSLQQQNRLRRLLEFQGYVNRRRIKEWCAEHVEIIDAILSNDMPFAAERMRQHLSHAYHTTGAADGTVKPPKPARVQG